MATARGSLVRAPSGTSVLPRSLYSTRVLFFCLLPAEQRLAALRHPLGRSSGFVPSSVLARLLPPARAPGGCGPTISFGRRMRNPIRSEIVAMGRASGPRLEWRVVAPSVRAALDSLLGKPFEATRRTPPSGASWRRWSGATFSRGRTLDRHQARETRRLHERASNSPFARSALCAAALCCSRCDRAPCSPSSVVVVVAQIPGLIAQMTPPQRAQDPASSNLGGPALA